MTFTPNRPSWLRSLILFSSLLGIPVLAPASVTPETELVHTFSIVGFDPENGDLGVAVASKFFAVGSVVPWAEAGVGAVATQASANTTFGPKGLAMMRTGTAAEEALKALLASDAQGSESRQVGIVDAQGRAATFTGKTCMSWAGGLSGKSWAAQGNILVSRATVDAMGRKFESTKGELAERLMAALEAGDAAGGDSRGRQSAALLVVRKAGGYRALNDRYIDLRVDDAVQPIVELRRLVSIALANAWMQHAYTLTEAGKHDEALAEIGRAIASRPQEKELVYHRACMLARAGKKDEALADLGKALRAVPSLAKQAVTDTDLESLRSDPRFKALAGSSSKTP